MSDTLPYESVPDYPPALTAGAIVARVLDGLGFRFRWSTHGLSAEEVLFSPAEGSMSILQLGPSVDHWAAEGAAGGVSAIAGRRSRSHRRYTPASGKHERR
jgi:hypothetical protein